jgi:hypothetical protein
LLLFYLIWQPWYKLLKNYKTRVGDVVQWLSICLALGPKFDPYYHKKKKKKKGERTEGGREGREEGGKLFTEEKLEEVSLES